MGGENARGTIYWVNMIMQLSDHNNTPISNCLVTLITNMHYCESIICECNVTEKVNIGTMNLHRRKTNKDINKVGPARLVLKT